MTGKILNSMAWKLNSGAQEIPYALYIHIPFCRSRCHYCDFATYVAPANIRDAYVDALIRELELRSADAPSPLKSVFFGGGTPTILSPAQLERILRALRRNFRLEQDAEITIEANPGSVDEEKLAVLRNYGVNRISLGAQTFNETLLMAIGRLHDAEAVDRSVELAKSAGFSHINLDLMFGLPDQTLADVETSIQRVLAYDVNHVSAYWLKVEPGTPFQKWRSEGLLRLPGEDAEADMYDLVRQKLQKAGYVHYEISNFCKPGNPSKHNLVYWHNDSYLAAGTGSHGYIKQVRYENTRLLKEYLERLRQGILPVSNRYDITPEEYAENTMMLGLRLREGVSKSRFRAKHGADLKTIFGDIIQSLERRGLVQWTGERLCLTPAAWPVGNLVFEEFVGSLVSN